MITFSLQEFLEGGWLRIASLQLLYREFSFDWLEQIISIDCHVVAVILFEVLALVIYYLAMKVVIWLLGLYV